MSGILLLSCGGYRSGSTYCYNLLGEYVEQGNVGRRVGYIEPSQVARLPEMWSFVDALGIAVGKSHNSPGTAAGAERWPDLLAGPATEVVPVCTVRDFRDVLHSFSRMFAASPEEVLASSRWQVNLRNLRWWLGSGALRIGYEDLLAAPAKVLHEMVVAAGLVERPELIAGAVEGAAVGAGGAGGAAAAAGTSPDEPVGVTVDDPSSTVNGRTLLHSGHVENPIGGGWRRWDPARLSALRLTLEPLLEEFGYAW
jgi:hypothetical protein